MKDIAIFGAGGLGREIALLIQQINEAAPTWNITGFYDEQRFTKAIDGFPYLGSIKELNAVASELHLVIGIGNSKWKRKVFEQIENPNIKFPVLIHPSVQLRDYQRCEIGEGSVIAQNVVITTNVKIGKHVQVSPASTLAHDVEVDDFCSLMYAINLAGNVKLNRGVYIGTNATVIQLLEVGENSIVGAGAVVTRSLPANCTAAGLPARIIKSHETPA
ncbi:acetyltransferase [Adhaeribacter terreus]|uniref:Acetyltransferase n=1 Tax=Adhaeribacter terreus TaxID=529703 RepID=A0ABW0EAQ7_9BACT